MKLVIIFGPPAAGKMTVGQELEKLTGYPLFHNHLSLELVNRFFDFGTPEFIRLDKSIRFAIFNEIAQSDLKGLIFTMVWALDDPGDHVYIQEIIQSFGVETQVYFIELAADQSVRLQRNVTENRLHHKPSKRDLSISEHSLRQSDQDYRMNSLPDEFSERKHLFLDVNMLRAVDAAQQIFKFITDN